MSLRQYDPEYHGYADALIGSAVSLPPFDPNKKSPSVNVNTETRFPTENDGTIIVPAGAIISRLNSTVYEITTGPDASSALQFCIGREGVALCMVEYFPVNMGDGYERFYDGPDELEPAPSAVSMENQPASLQSVDADPNNA